METRLKAFNEMGAKMQTFEKVEKVVADYAVNVDEACSDIRRSVEKDIVRDDEQTLEIKCAIQKLRVAAIDAE